jgi:DNA-binding protein HU-beta
MSAKAAQRASFRSTSGIADDGRPYALLASPRPDTGRRKTSVTKSEFIDQVAEESELPKAEATKAVEAFLKVVQDSLSRGGEINFTGFGKFSVAERGARQGVNPQTGERIDIAASRVPRFSAGSALKNAVKG